MKTHVNGHFQIELNIAPVKIRCTRSFMLNPYRENPDTGSIILIDENTNETVAAG